MTYPQLVAIIEKHLLLADHQIVKFLCGVVIANKIKELDPTWVFLVSSSSGGKSSLLEAFNQLQDIIYIDDMTGNTLISGAKRAGKETSFIHRIPKYGMLMMTDFTLLLDKDEETNKKIMSQLRLIYDGKIRKAYGTGEEVPWNGQFGVVAGTTTAIYEKQQQFAALGERMIYYYMDQPDREKATEMALDNIKDKKNGRLEMAAAIKEYIEGVKIPDTLSVIPKEQQSYLIKLSEMATRARSAVGRKKYHRDNPITMTHALEMPMRMALQLLNLGYGMAALNEGNVLLPEDYTLLYKAALDSIPLERKKLMEKMTAFQSTDVSGAAASLGMPFDTTKAHMEDLSALGVVTQYKSHAQGRFYYELLPQYRELISKFRNIEMTTKVLEKPQGVDNDEIVATAEGENLFPPMPPEHAEEVEINLGF